MKLTGLPPDAKAVIKAQILQLRADIPNISAYEKDKREQEILKKVRRFGQAPVRFMNRKERRKQAALKRAKGN